MARKGQVSIQESIDNDGEFAAFLQSNAQRIICLEVYSDFCGFCLATGNAIRKGKLEIGQDRIAMAKALADNIDALSRFSNKSEPVFLFIMKGQLTRAMFGANGIELCRIIEEELGLMQKEIDTGVTRPKQDISQMLPEEEVKLKANLRIEEEYREAAERLRVLTTAERKKRVTLRLSQLVKQLNFILFWPHCHDAHPALYEKWDLIKISVKAKEEVQLNEATAKEVLYMSDVDPNEACIHALCNGECLAVLFKMDDNRDFIKLLRYALYEEIPIPKEDVPVEKQVPPIPAYERYASMSKTKREVRRERHERKLEKLRNEQEERERLASEQARLAREAEEDRVKMEKQRQDEERIARLQQGDDQAPMDQSQWIIQELLTNLTLPALVEEVVEDEDGEKVEEEGGEKAQEEGGEKAEEKAVEDLEKGEAEEDFHSDVSVEGEEYIPPGGLFVPGLYAPPNEMAKANGLAFFYPKVVKEMAKIESEFLPPHVLVMFHIEKRADVRDIVKQYTDEILALGIFVGDEVSSAEHIAFSIKQYEKMERHRRHKDRLALMVSRKRSLPLLQLAGLNPCYISADLNCGERDCLKLFPVGYGDDFEEEESIVEEEEIIAEVVPEPEPDAEVEVTQLEQNEDEKENEED